DERVPEHRDAGLGLARRGGARHRRGADRDGRGARRGDSGGGGLQPLPRAAARVRAPRGSVHQRVPGPAPRDGGCMKVGPSRMPLAEINVTPLVDVVLVLLIIFMVTAPFMQGGLEIDLPKVAARGLDVREGL